MDENYLQFEPRVNDFGDSYHHPDEELYSDLATSVRNIRRKYRHYNEYVVAMRLVEDYIEQLIEKYHGRKNLKIAMSLGTITEFIPPIPKFRNTEENRLQSNAGVILSEQTGEMDTELSDDFAKSVELESVDSCNGMDLRESHLVYLPFEITGKTKRLLDDTNAIVSELEMLNRYSNSAAMSKKQRKRSSHNLMREAKRRKKLMDKASRPETIGDIIKSYNDLCNGLTGEEDNDYAIYKGIMIPQSELDNINLTRDMQAAGFISRENLSSVNSKKIRKMIRKENRTKKKKKKHDSGEFDSFLDAYDSSDQFGTSFNAFKHEMETFNSDSLSKGR